MSPSAFAAASPVSLTLLSIPGTHQYICQLSVHLVRRCTCTVEPWYVDLELPAISNRIGFPLDLPLFFFSVIYCELSRTRLSRIPCYLELFLPPLISNQPRYLELYYVPKKHWSTSVRKCSQGTSWQVLRVEKCIDVFLVSKAKSNWLDLLLRMQKATSCRSLLILGIKLLLQKFDANLAITNYFSMPLRVRDSGVLLYYETTNYKVGMLTNWANWIDRVVACWGAMVELISAKCSTDFPESWKGIQIEIYMFIVCR